MTRTDARTRILVVDDSPIIRDMVSAILVSDPALTVVGQASNGLEAVSKAAALRPDIITMDIEMPVMDGLEAIETIMARQPVPILVLTSHTGVRVAFAAVSRGALDVVEKPALDLENGAKLIKKVKILARVDVLAHQKAMGKPAGPDVALPEPALPAGGKAIVAIAASTGGPRALERIFSRLPAGFPVPIVVSQHVADGFTEGMAEWLNSSTTLEVVMARRGDILKPGKVYLNPSESTLKITRQGSVLLTPGDPAQVYHPSCNAMLGSVAASFGPRAVGLILTGMGDDGVAGMKAIKAAGGFTLAQDEKTSIVYGMNGVAVREGCIDRVNSLDDIPAQLMRLTADEDRQPDGDGRKDGRDRGC